ncbi:hypothetical protein [Elizabethkingia ursingii]|uniref:Uncharacterized protein n=1 Tax=Elizabethkingia ursingii TaxID=1756150 RepID=A0AAJ3TN54_9FLAO|nr:hypothetical protein [Elizabethkingia ursingii]AQX08003.1 hypothetical protein BBD34_04805 [Elizabethkingia ursingii]OPB73643.1 hypothetical protein BAY32_11415 [Elizabethkingia ursingii]
MKLVKVEINAYDRSNGRPLLTVSKSGKFSISPTMRNKIGYKPGHKINFFQEEGIPKNWYITLDYNEGEKIRETQAGKYIATFIQNSGLAILMRKLFIIEGVMTFSIGTSTQLQGVDYWPLLLNK